MFNHGIKSVVNVWEVEKVRVFMWKVLHLDRVLTYTRGIPQRAVIKDCVLHKRHPPKSCD